jgi:hypothetical protein
VKAQVGGKLAQLGARLIEGTARQYAEGFFARLKAEVENAEGAGGEGAGSEGAATPAAPDAPAVPTAAEPLAAAPRAGLPPLLWGSALILATLAFLWWQWS